jgi:hypothetical protein
MRYLIYILFTTILFARVDYNIKDDMLTIECTKDECKNYTAHILNNKLIIKLPNNKRRGYEDISLMGYKITQTYIDKDDGYTQIVIDKKDIKKYYVKGLDSKIAIFRRFYYTTIPNDKLKKMKRYTLSKECSIDTSTLRYVLVPYVDFVGDKGMGEIVVHQDLAQEVAEIFYGIYLSKFPIKRLTLVETFKGDENFSMRANNTVGFSCREYNDTNIASMHSLGRAIDINPMQNPYINGKDIKPIGSREYRKRRILRDGMLTSDSIPVKLFKYYGWKWGGEWSSVKDYQYFEKR